ncbi:flagellar export chaperone FliS [Sporosarcina highlanderae]|uniref:Flagellar secretion chaperone FliS n=1 Tax=Sporosarcina highlanderae TaxID=3035916 RepID=A0ABT8JQI3_9BACL|nr:flagellar export chaperone FliS [Sporosarcina highlanderae]MDN4606826.1 flagellar export chaperone FliS [Sporosarcina highlanderae]
MAINNPYTMYQNNSVNTSTPGELTLMLYNGCLKFIHQAKKALEQGNIEEKNTATQKAQAIVNELMVTLDRSVPISENMMTLYEFVNHRLLEGNIKNDGAMYNEAAEIITEFRDTWKQVIQINRSKQYANMDGI